MLNWLQLESMFMYACRILRHVPTIERAFDRGALAVVLISHRGKPRGRRDEELTLEPIAHFLAEHVKRYARPLQLLKHLSLDTAPSGYLYKCASVCLVIFSTCPSARAQRPPKRARGQKRAPFTCSRTCASTPRKKASASTAADRSYVYIWAPRNLV